MPAGAHRADLWCDYAGEGTWETNLESIASARRRAAERITASVSNEDVLSVTLSRGVCISSQGDNTCLSFLCHFWVCHIASSDFLFPRLKSFVCLVEPHTDATPAIDLPFLVHTFSTFGMAFLNRELELQVAVMPACQGHTQGHGGTSCSFGPCWSVGHLVSIAVVGSQDCWPQPSHSQLGACHRWRSTCVG